LKANRKSCNGQLVLANKNKHVWQYIAVDNNMWSFKSDILWTQGIQWTCGWGMKTNIQIDLEHTTACPKSLA
jgi:hypothetical protein